MIPDSMDCPASVEERNRINALFGVPVAPPPPTYPLHNSEGLIVPRKPQNPCLESRGHKDIHRELLFNQKVGKSVLGQKSELQRALEKHKESQARREEEHVKEESQLTKIIHERAKRLENAQATPKQPTPEGPEFLQVHAKLRARMDSK